MSETLQRTCRILLVEDDDAQAHLVRLAVGSHNSGNQLTHLRNGEEAIEYLRKIVKSADPQLPDLVLLDLKMPKMDGHELLRLIKEDPQLRPIYVVILTTSSSDDDKSRAYANHANSYLVKPLNFDEFESMVNDLINYWCGWNQPPLPVRPGDIK